MGEKRERSVDACGSKISQNSFRRVLNFIITRRVRSAPHGRGL